MLLAAPTPGVLVVDADGVRVRVRVHANVYTYDITNERATAIREFAVPYSDGHTFTAPDGWTLSAEDGVFRAEAPENGRAIASGQTGSFSFRTTTHGAALGFVDLRLGAASGMSSAVPHVWGAVPLPSSYVLLMAAFVLALAGLLTAVLDRTDRRSQPPVTAL